MLPRARPWVMRMRWLDLLFAHWPLDPAVLRPLVPGALELDTWDGRAWIGVVPFRMEDVGLRGLPAPPILGAFPEVNVRTYVQHAGRPGVWFLSLDAASRPTVLGARTWFHLPYVFAEMSAEREGDAVEYRSRRADPDHPPAALDLRYRPTGPVEWAAAGSFESWLTDRFRLFALDRAGSVLRTEIRHAPWPLQPAEASFRTETLTAAHGLVLPADPPHLRFARRVDVRGWWPRPA